MITQFFFVTLFFGSPSKPYHLNAKITCSGYDELSKKCKFEMYREPPSKCGNFSYEIYEVIGKGFKDPVIKCMEPKPLIDLEVQ